jgi:hypothetical protein
LRGTATGDGAQLAQAEPSDQFVGVRLPPRVTQRERVAVRILDLVGSRSAVGMSASSGRIGVTGMSRLSAAAISSRTKSPGSSGVAGPPRSGVQPLPADEREDHVCLQPPEHLPEIASGRDAVHVDKDVVPADVIRDPPTRARATIYTSPRRS